MLFNLRFFLLSFWLHLLFLMSTILFIWKVYEMCLHCKLYIYILNFLFILFLATLDLVAAHEVAASGGHPLVVVRSVGSRI